MTLPPDIERLADELAEEVEALLAPLVRASRQPASLRRLLQQAGWDLDTLLGVDPDALADTVAELARSLGDLAGRLTAASDLQALGSTVRAALDGLADLVAGAEADAVLALLFPDAGDAAHRRSLVGELARDVVDHLLLRHLQARAPAVVELGRLTGLVVTTRAPALYATPDALPGAAPVRLPLRRPRINRAGLVDTLLVPVSAVVADLPRGSYDSPLEFVAGVQHVLRRRLGDVLRSLALRGPGPVAVGVGPAGIELHAPELLPTTLLANWPDLDDADGVSVPLSATAPHPALELGRETWRLAVAGPDAADPVPVLGGVLELRPGLSRPTVRGVTGPGVSVVLDGAGSGRLTLSVALALVLDPASPAAELAATITAALAGEALEVGVALESVGPVRVPVALPGLTGTALSVEDAALELLVGGGEGDPLLDVRLGARGFTVELPAELTRPVRRTAPDAPWEIAPGPVRVTFALEDPAGDPVALLDLGVTGGDDGILIDRLAFATTGPLRLRVDADPMLLGTDPRHGLVLEIDGFTLDTEPGGAVGPVTVAAARLHLPAAIDGLPSGVEVTDVVLADRGISGRAALVFPGPEPGAEPARLFGVLPVELRCVVITLEDSVPVEFELAARIEMPWFDEPVDVRIGLDADFDLTFRVDTADPAGITLTKEELLSLTFRSAALTYDGDARTLSLALSGGLQPLLWNADGLQWPRLDVAGLVVEQDLASLAEGRVDPPRLRFDAAWLDLDELATLDLYGFAFELRRVGVGYLEDTDELWIDLSGSLRLIDVLPVGLGVEGFRIVWPRRILEELDLGDGALDVEDLLAVADRIQVRFAGIEILLGVPGTAEIEGLLRFVKDADTVGFAGDGALRVPATGLVVEAGLTVGTTFPPSAPPFPFLYAHFGVTLPVGIPLAQSGLALKGARGLFGINVEPDREPGANPYHDWYKRGPVEGVHPATKWRDRLGGIALGAGVTITTADGRLLGVQGLFVVALPGPIVMIEGKALVLDGVFPGDGPLKALGFFDGNELTAQINVEASAELVAGLLDVTAGLEAYFDFRAPDRWYLHLGRDQPPERRVHARLLDLPGIGWLFSADAWLMLDTPAGGTLRSRLGVHVGLAPPPIDLAVASVRVEAVVDGEQLLTLNPLQLTGSFALRAALEVEAFGLVLAGIEADAEMAIDGPRPLVVDARVAVRVDLPVPDPDDVPVVGEWVAGAVEWFEEEVADLPEIPAAIDVEVPLRWELDGPPEIPPLVSGVTVESAWTGAGGPALPDFATELLDAPVVPLDARPTVVFDQHVGVAGDVALGGFTGAGVERFASGGLAFRPWLRRLRLWRLPLHAVDPDAAEQPWELAGDTGSDDPGLALWGTFRPAARSDDPALAARRVLDLLPTNPFEHLAGTVPLGVPASAASADQAPVGPAPAVGGDAGLRWCGPDEPVEQCTDGAALAGAPRRPVPVAVADGWMQELIVDAISFRDADLRLVGAGAGSALAASGRGGAGLRIVFPERVESAHLTFDGPLPDAVTACRAGPLAFSRRDRPRDRCAEPAGAEVRTSGTTVTVRTTDGGFDCLLVRSKGRLVVTAICRTGADEAERARAQAAACARNDAVATFAAEPGTVLAAGHLHKLEITTAIELDETASEPAALALAGLPGLDAGLAPYRAPGGHEQTDTFLFRTNGPADDLAPYVRWSSGPADRPLHLADDDVVVRFARPYVHRLFADPDNGADGPPGSPFALEAWIVDAAGHVLDGWFLNWTDAGSATLTTAERRWYDEIVGVVPPPDDILEIRRPLDLLGLGELGAAGLRPERRSPLPGRRTRWQPRPDGTVRVRPGGPGRDLAHLGGPRAAGGRVDVAVEPASARGQVGLVLLDDGAGSRYELLLTPARGRVALVRVEGDRRVELAAADVEPGARRFPISIVTAPDGGGLRVRARVDGAVLEALDPGPVSTRGRLGVLAEDTGATFGPLAAGPGGHELAPGARYTVVLTGGEGGVVRLRADFADPAARTLPGLVTEGAWTAVAGAIVGAAGARLDYHPAVDDGEVVQRVRAAPGDRLTLVLRSPDSRRAPGDASAYELAIERGPDEVTLRLERAGGPGRAPLGVGGTPVGVAPVLAVRVRILADRVRAWVFDRLLLDVELGAGVDSPGDVVRAGSLAWLVDAGAPALCDLEVRSVALLSQPLTTSRYRLFAELVRAAVAGPPLATTLDLATLADRVAQAIASQTALAAARIAFDAEAAIHRLGGSDRDAVEQRRQAAVVAAAVHDALFLDVLLDLEAVDGTMGPDVCPVWAAGSTPAGHLLRSPESWEPRMDAPHGTLPHPVTGRTSFALLDGGGTGTGWVASADGTTVLVFATDPTSGRLTGGPSATSLRVTHVRDHGDAERSEPGYDHRHDRPYRRAADGREPVVVDLTLGS